MTRQRSFKQLVRARMAKTGESYTAARAQLLAGADEVAFNTAAIARPQLLTEAAAAFEAAGLRGFWRGYFALRAAVVAGHSMGGMILMEFAGDFPAELDARVAGLVFMDTAAYQILPRVALPVARALGRRIRDRYAAGDVSAHGLAVARGRQRNVAKGAARYRARGRGKH